jgi:PAS domain S-box-containing protein
MTSPRPITGFSRLLFPLLAVLAALGLALGGYWFVQRGILASQDEHYEHLETIARLKTDQLLAWREERLADARMHSSGQVQILAIEWQRTSDPKVLDRIADRLKVFRENESYHNLILVDTEGRILVTLIDRSTTLEKEERLLLLKALSAQQPVIDTFYSCQTCGMLHLNVAVPVLGEDNRAVAVLILVADPARDIFPLVQNWPVAHENAESFLVRKEADGVSLLSPLRHKEVPPLSFAIGLSPEDAPELTALLGQSGRVVGKDYRGEPMLADIRAVPGTPWQMVTKMDLNPILAGAILNRGGIVLLVAMAIGMTAVIARLAAVSRQKDLSEALLRVEQEHSKSRKEIRATLYGIGDGVLSVDRDGLVTRMNPEAERLTGWREEEALGQPLADVFQLFGEERGEPQDLPLMRVLVSGEVVAASYHALLADREGRRRPVTDSWSPICGDHGDITGAVLVFRDQTRRRAIESARAESARRYSNLVESIHDLIWETGPDHRFTFVSSRVIDILGYDPEEIVGRSWEDILQVENDEAKASVDAFLGTLTSQQPCNQLRKAVSRRNGGLVLLESSATPVFNQRKCFLGYRGVSRDITDRHRAEEEQEKLAAQLHQAQRLDTVGRLAGGVAHDFNNMLTVICSYTEMILAELGEAHPQSKRLAEVHRAALHSAELTRQLLAFARKQVISPRILDLNETIGGTLKMLERLIGENIRLGWKPGRDLWPVKMDTTQVGQILANLAVNARDAILANDGHLVMTTENVSMDDAACAGRLEMVPGDYVRLTVSDNGCGMDKETLAQIFEPFFTTKGEGSGTGLGLATVYGIVRQNEGFVSVYSEPGQGTTFRIYLPRVESTCEESVLPDRNETISGNETILICEDEAAILDLAVSILERQGYKVLGALTPTLALELARNHEGPVHLLVTDVVMPEMNGRDLMEQITRLRPGLRRLYMSGYTADIIARHGVLDAGFHFIEKPFSARGLSAKVREVLSHA